MNKIVKISLTALVIAFILAGIFYFLKLSPAAQAKPVFQKGICYTTWSKNAYNTGKSDRSLEKIKSINTDWINILATWYQDSCYATEIFSTNKTPSDESMKRAIDRAHSLGMKVMVKPHVDLLTIEAGGWRGEITCVRESDWDKWFKSYKNFILHYAKLAEETKAEMFCIGTELTSTTAAHTDKWREIISAVRKVYKGKLTYAANWREEYLHIRFWDALDYAGIDAYFPLSDKDNPGYDELMEGWKKWLPEITEWQKSIDMPVIFPEIGYRSSLGAAKNPWEHAPGIKAALELQVNCYKALVDTFWDKEWFYGVYWWDWGTDVRMGGRLNRGFTPQNKPAQDYVEKLYKQRAPR